MKARIPALALLATALFAQLGVFSGTKTVTTAGTAVQLTTTNTPFKSGTIQALSTNTGTICIGPSTVLAASKNGVCLTAGQAEPLYNVPTFSHDLSSFWIDSTVNGEGVAYQYEQ